MQPNWGWRSEVFKGFLASNQGEVCTSSLLQSSLSVQDSRRLMWWGDESRAANGDVRWHEATLELTEEQSLIFQSAISVDKGDQLQFWDSCVWETSWTGCGRSLSFILAPENVTLLTSTWAVALIIGTLTRGRFFLQADGVYSTTHESDTTSPNAMLQAISSSVW